MHEKLYETNFAKRFHAVQRIVISIAIAAFVGGLIGIYAGPHEVRDHNMFVGFALALPVGFLLGLCWQHRVGLLVPSIHVLIMGLVSFGMGASAILEVIPAFQREVEFLDRLRTLRPGSIEKLIVYCGEERLSEGGSAQSDQDIVAFVAACRDVQGGVAKRWMSDYIDITIDIRFKSGKEITLYLFYDSDNQDAVYGGYSTSQDAHRVQSGNLRSAGLMRWISEREQTFGTDNSSSP